jgi:hypothetical protein
VTAGGHRACPGPRSRCVDDHVAQQRAQIEDGMVLWQRDGALDASDVPARIERPPRRWPASFSGVSGTYQPLDLPS